MTITKVRIRQQLKRHGVRYLLVGGSVYAVELAIILIAQWSGLSAVTAVAIAFVVGLLLSFSLQKLVTFGDRRLQRKVVGPQLLAVSLLVLFNFGFILLMTDLLQHHLPTVLTRTLALGITTIWNFYLYKTRIFKGAAGLIG